MLQELTPSFILTIVGGYFAILMLISWWTGRNADNEDFFIGGRQSSWILVAIGMIGASLSGVTFISVPGLVGANGPNQDFSSMQLVFGYLVGYTIIALVLMPLYYRLRLTSIYGYLEERFGWWSYKTGAIFFLLSRILGASLRLYLVAMVLQEFVMNAFGVPFWLTTLIIIALIWVYTFRGGIKTIVYTDTLQTLSMLTAVVLTIIAIGNELGEDIGGLFERVSNSEYSRMFFFDSAADDPNNFFKQFISGALIATTMTGLDQDMMQKNLSCRSLGDAQKNVFTFSIILVFANLLFLSLGALLYIYANVNGITIPESTDQLYPTIALQHLSPTIGIVFIIGLIAAAYSSADSALTALTTSFCVDILGGKKRVPLPSDGSSEKADSRRDQSSMDAHLTASTAPAENVPSNTVPPRTRLLVHVGFSVLLLLIIVGVYAAEIGAVLNVLFKLAGYTYGPLLGLYAFGMISGRSIRDPWVPLVCLVSIALTYVLTVNQLFVGFELGFLNILLNGVLTFLGIFAISRATHD